jgi:acyl-lipid omega-6 desaturase (Delta-12 desaturase)
MPEDFRQGAPAARPALLRLLDRYRDPDVRRSVWQVVNTAAPFAALWLLMLYFVDRAYVVTLLLAVPTGLLLVRLFIIQHDCGHGAFFRSMRVSNALGFVLGVVTLTPYHYWRKIHAIHHAGAGNLERRGFGDVDTLTVREYLALSRGRRFRYRLYRNPFVMFGVGPWFEFVIKHRLPTLVPPTWKRERFSIHFTNLALTGVVALAALTIGLRRLALVHAPVFLVAGTLGVWLFYVQHQFRDTYWEHESAWDYVEAGSKGSSYYALPAVLAWFTGHIGLHHIHHLTSRIPNYRLQRALEENPELQRVTRLTPWRSLACVFYKLWDEEQGRLVGYRYARRLQAAAVPPAA